ncbi:MAG TPA: hypothetical protein VK791_08015 [bacterium]|nr:hypothetical protein [bacterium]
MKVCDQKVNFHLTNSHKGILSLFNAKLFFPFLFSLTFFGFLQAQAQSITNETNSPIETQADLGFMAILGGDMQYSLNDQKIVHYRDFKSLIYPMRDAQASNMIRDAEATDLISWIILATGISAAVDIAALYKPPVVFNSDLADRAVETVVLSQIGFGAFAIVHNIAEGRKFNAIQRYNHLLWEKHKESSIELMPKLYASTNGFVLGGQLNF